MGTTLVDGRVVAEKVIIEEDTLVMRSPGPDHELFCIKRERFDLLYQDTCDIDAEDPYYIALKERGFQSCKPKPDLETFVYEISVDDVAVVPTRCFASNLNGVSFGLTELREGDFMALGMRERNVYVISATTVSTCWEPVTPR